MGASETSKVPFVHAILLQSLKRDTSGPLARPIDFLRVSLKSFHPMSLQYDLNDNNSDNKKKKRVGYEQRVQVFPAAYLKIIS